MDDDARAGRLRCHLSCAEASTQVGSSRTRVSLLSPPDCACDRASTRIRIGSRHPSASPALHAPLCCRTASMQLCGTRPTPVISSLTDARHILGHGRSVRASITVWHISMYGTYILVQYLGPTCREASLCTLMSTLHPRCCQPPAARARRAKKAEETEPVTAVKL